MARRGRHRLQPVTCQKRRTPPTVIEPVGEHGFGDRGDVAPANDEVRREAELLVRVRVQLGAAADTFVYMPHLHFLAAQRRAAAKTAASAGEAPVRTKTVPVLTVPGGNWYGTVDALLTAELAAEEPTTADAAEPPIPEPSGIPLSMVTSKPKPRPSSSIMREFVSAHSEDDLRLGMERARSEEEVATRAIERARDLRAAARHLPARRLALPLLRPRDDLVPGHPADRAAGDRHRHGAQRDLP